MENAYRKSIAFLVIPYGPAYGLRSIFGPTAVNRRHAVMHKLGYSLPKSKCGYHAVRDALIKELNIPLICTARQDELIVKALNS